VTIQEIRDQLINMASEISKSYDDNPFVVSKTMILLDEFDQCLDTTNCDSSIKRIRTLIGDLSNQLETDIDKSTKVLGELYAIEDNLKMLKHE
jgi:hypothetical protein